MSREDELRDLVRHLMVSREEEKARVARELHDEMGSSLTAVNMDLMSVRQRLGEDSPHAERLARAASALKSAVEGMRRIIEELRPSMLESLGLREAILPWATDYADRSGIPLTVDIADEFPPLPAGSPIGLFRIAQEALANAIRHAGARAIRLSMRVEGGNVILQVVDDGTGIVPRPAEKGAAHGLLGIRERAIAIGGDATIGSGPGGIGTEVRVTVPVTNPRGAKSGGARAIGPQVGTDDEEKGLRSAALENARNILASRRRAERELIDAQEALLELNARLQVALEAGKLGTWNWDAATDQLVLGSRAADVVGLPANVPFTRVQIREHLPPEDAERARHALDKAIAERSDYACEYRVNRPDGGQRWIAASGRGVYADDGTVLGMTGVMQDITKKKREEQALRDADSRKDEFLATLAHELRNPLAPLRTSLEILGNEIIGPEVKEAARLVMLRQVNQMVALIDELIDISRISTGRIDLHREPVALSAVVASALEISRPLIDARGHTLALELAADPIYIDADRTRIAQVLSNLLNNAAKYAGQNGRIGLSSARQGDEVLVSVADSGIGIAPEMLSRVFELFVQVDNSLARAESGLGVGLTLARRLAELHGGTLEARSGGLGKGSEFLLRLKTVAAPASPVQALAGAGGITGSRCRRVLVVDDNIDHADSMSTLLRLDGHEVRTAYNGLEAIDAVAAAHPEIVLLDIGMPGLNGYDTARRIRETCGGGVKLIALSGWGQARDRELSVKAGFDHHLVKPVEPADLQRLLAEEPPAAPRSGGGRMRVLLVDDNADLRASLAEVLQLSGCEIRTAPDGVAAIAAALDWRPDVAFIDIHMPRMNGFQVARKLREQFRPGSMKLILMSGLTIDEALARDAKQAGFDAWIDKVAEPDLWLRHLEPALAG